MWLLRPVVCCDAPFYAQGTKRGHIRTKQLLCKLISSTGNNDCLNTSAPQRPWPTAPNVLLKRSRKRIGSFLVMLSFLQSNVCGGALCWRCTCDLCYNSSLWTKDERHRTKDTRCNLFLLILSRRPRCIILHFLISYHRESSLQSHFIWLGLTPQRHDPAAFPPVI